MPSLSGAEVITTVRPHPATPAWGEVNRHHKEVSRSGFSARRFLKRVHQQVACPVGSFFLGNPQVFPRKSIQKALDFFIFFDPSTCSSLSTSTSKSSASALLFLEPFEPFKELWGVLVVVGSQLSRALTLFAFFTSSNPSLSTSISSTSVLRFLDPFESLIESGVASEVTIDDARDGIDN